MIYACACETVRIIIPLISFCRMEPLLGDDVFEEFRHCILPSSEKIDSHKNKSKLTFPEDVICPENVDRIRNFFQSADSLEKGKLIDIFDEVDQINRIDPKDPKTAEVAEVVEAFVRRILQRVGEMDSRFSSTLLRGGSFYDGVKIGRPDEFDFTAKIEKLCSVDGLEGRFSTRKKGFVYLVVKNSESMQDFKEFVIQAEEDDALEKGDQILSVRKIENYFSELVDKALRSIDIPRALTPADEKNGLSWHSVHCGPCATIHATYHSKSLEEMNISIDIAPTFDLRMPKSTSPVPALELKGLSCFPGAKNEFLSKLRDALNQSEITIMVVPFAFDKIHESKGSERPSWFYEYSETWRVSFNSLEKFIFSQFAFDSVEKQLYRVLKILKAVFIQKSSELESKAGTRDMKFEEPPSTKMSSVTIEPVGFVSGFKVASNFADEQNDESGDETDDEASTDSLSEPEQKYEVLYDRSSLSSNSDTDEQPATGNGSMLSSPPLDNVRMEADEEQNYTSQIPPKNDSKMDSTQECMDSKPLIKTYFFKMIFFYMKFLLPDERVWTRENLPELVLFVLKTLFFVYSSKQRRFINFWLQEMIELPARPSVALEVLQSLENIVEELEATQQNWIASRHFDVKV